MSHNDIGEQIIGLQQRLETVRNKQIRLSSRKETLAKARDELITEITEAGYDPATLSETYTELKKQLEEKCSQLDTLLTEAETILNSFTE